ncbi:MAG: hypothetical protein E7362_03960 [Clostridiales bacterium]|nr:hypothetical protein [Clostridiales bacterium]
MRLGRYLIFGIIEKAITLVVKVVLKILGFFHLTPMFLVGLVGIVLYFTGVLNNQTAKIVFDVAIGLCAFYALCAILYSFTGRAKKDRENKRGKVEVVKKKKGKKGEEEPVQPVIIQQPVIMQQPTSQPVIMQQPISQPVIMPQQMGVQPVYAPAQAVPTYYEVKNNPSFVMAEYTDKYILYKKTGSGLVKIRTDYK